MKAVLLALVLSILPGNYFPAKKVMIMENSTLTVQVHSLRNANGSVRLTLFRSGNGFPSDLSKALRKATGKIEDGKCTLVLDNLPPGDYAISLLHDENNNEKMDTGLMGIPKEGYGASNDAKVMFGPPKYEDARFALQGNQMTIQIKMRYF